VLRGYTYEVVEVEMGPSARSGVAITHTPALAPALGALPRAPVHLNRQQLGSSTGSAIDYKLFLVQELADASLSQVLARPLLHDPRTGALYFVSGR
jgi:hypothetical protein